MYLNKTYVLEIQSVNTESNVNNLLINAFKDHNVTIYGTWEEPLFKAMWCVLWWLVMLSLRSNGRRSLRFTGSAIFGGLLVKRNKSGNSDKI